MIVVDIMILILYYNTRTQSQWTSRALLSPPSNRSFPSTTVCWKTSRSGLLLKKIYIISFHFFFQHRPMVGSSEATKNCQSLSGCQNCATISTQKIPMPAVHSLRFWNWKYPGPLFLRPPPVLVHVRAEQRAVPLLPPHLRHHQPRPLRQVDSRWKVSFMKRYQNQIKKIFSTVILSPAVLSSTATSWTSTTRATGRSC